MDAYRAIHVQWWECCLALPSPIQSIEHREHFPHSSRILLKLRSEPDAGHSSFLRAGIGFVGYAIRLAAAESRAELPSPSHRVLRGTPCNRTGVAGLDRLP